LRGNCPEQPRHGIGIVAVGRRIIDPFVGIIVDADRCWRGSQNVDMMGQREILHTQVGRDVVKALLPVINGRALDAFLLERWAYAQKADCGGYGITDSHGPLPPR